MAALFFLFMKRFQSEGRAREQNAPLTSVHFGCRNKRKWLSRNPLVIYRFPCNPICELIRQARYVQRYTPRWKFRNLHLDPFEARILCVPDSKRNISVAGTL